MRSGSTIDIPRLAKLCGMFSSEHLGERAAAAAKADRLVRSAGLAWCDVLACNLPAPGGSKARPPQSASLTPASILAMYGPALTAWEKQFLAGLVRRGGAWTTKQNEVLTGIKARFG